MKALLRKDLYQLMSQLKVFVILMLVFCAMPQGSFTFFGVLYSVLMTSTTLISMDETSKWELLALMLPYSRRKIVAEKYVLGWICLSAALAVSASSRALWSVLGAAGGFDLEYLSVLCVYGAVALVIQAVSIPIHFRFGVAKGGVMTIVFLGMVSGIVAAASFISSPEDALSTVRALTAHLHIAAYPLLAAALSAATIPLSVRGYLKRVER